MADMEFCVHLYANEAEVMSQPHLHMKTPCAEGGQVRIFRIFTCEYLSVLIR